MHPGAKGVFVGKEMADHGWPQDRINAAIVAAARQVKRLVRLRSVDPSIFGRASEEILAALGHGIDIDIIPGVTAAASAAAASLCEPLTMRGVPDRIPPTVTCRPGVVPSDLTEIARSGTTLVFFVLMQHLSGPTAQLVMAEVDPDQSVTIADNVARPDGRKPRTSLAGTTRDCAAVGLTNPAVVILDLPKSGAAFPRSSHGNGCP